MPLRAFDVNWRPSIWGTEISAGDVLRDAANQADIAFVGLDEAREVWNTSSVAEIRKLLPKPEMVIVKDSERGAHAIVGSRAHFIKALSGPVVEPVGAGRRLCRGRSRGNPLLRGGRFVVAQARTTITAMSALAQASDVGQVIDPKTTERLLSLSTSRMEHSTARRPTIRSKRLGGQSDTALCPMPPMTCPTATPRRPSGQVTPDG